MLFPPYLLSTIEFIASKSWSFLKILYDLFLPSFVNSSSKLFVSRELLSSGLKGGSYFYK